MNPYSIFRNLIRNNKTRWLVTLVTVIYLLSPVDLIPEILVPLVGFIDDGILVSIFISELVQARKEALMKRNEKNSKHIEQTDSRVVDVEPIHKQ